MQPLLEIPRSERISAKNAAKYGLYILVDSSFEQVACYHITMIGNQQALVNELLEDKYISNLYKLVDNYDKFVNYRESIITENYVVPEKFAEERGQRDRLYFAYTVAYILFISFVACLDFMCLHR